MIFMNHFYIYQMSMKLLNVVTGCMQGAVCSKYCLTV